MADNFQKQREIIVEETETNETFCVFVAILV